MSWLQRIHLALFPPACRQCGRMLEPLSREVGFPHLCAACHAALPWLPPEPVPAPHDAGVLDGVWAACRYEAPVDRWIWRYKYERHEGSAHLLAGLLRSAPWRAAPLAGVDVVAPVPLHPRRLHERGFNQALLLAHHWLRGAGALGVPRGARPRLWPTLLARRRYTTPQMRMDAAARADNVARAFALERPPPQARSPEPGAPLAGLRILLVDDVMTTGATLIACAAPLKEAGAASVSALVLARA